MDFFFVEYRDPLFGLIFLTILILVVALSHYIWRIFASKDEEQKLEKFIKKFEMAGVHQDLLRSGDLSFGNLVFLAEIFTKSGEFEKATQIYLIALEKSKDKKEQELIFLALAKVYFKAGFLERSKEVLLNALKIRPRNIEALKLLNTIYLCLRSYKESLELLQCLFELGVEIHLESEFIKALSIEAQNKNMEKKIEALLNLDFKNNIWLKRWLYEKYHIWQEQDLFCIIDLLYKEKKPIFLENLVYKEFFYSQLLLDFEENFKFQNSDFKMLYILKNNHFKVKLDFSYMCLECKHTMPLFFYHCPICYTFGKCKILFEVKNDEKD